MRCRLVGATRVQPSALALSAQSPVVAPATGAIKSDTRVVILRTSAGNPITFSAIAPDMGIADISEVAITRRNRAEKNLKITEPQVIPDNGIISCSLLGML